jgi:hypothetical protein
MLMAELAKGDASPSAPYFATLPEATDCLLNWSEDERQLLAGGSLGSCVNRVVRVASFYGRIEAKYFQQLGCWSLLGSSGEYGGSDA